MHTNKNRRGAFALAELAVVILILAVLAGVLVPRVSDRLATARDARRIADIARLQSAIERYYLDKGAYPPATLAKAGNGYDVSSDNNFIPELLRGGYLREPLQDPVNDAGHYYAYNLFPKGAEGCKGRGAFYVLGIKRFETANFAAEHPGYFKCAQKDWSEEFDYVCGGGTSERSTKAAAAVETR